jgi:uncharacterized coiled-coil DUF342 family protein
MAIQILQDIADALPKIDENIEEMKELISFAQEQGEPVVELNQQLAKLKQQRQKMYNSLKKRGYVT